MEEKIICFFTMVLYECFPAMNDGNTWLTVDFSR